jgi:hypothetical protein
MYIELKNETISIEFNPHLFVQIFNEKLEYYYVELREYLKNDTNSKFLEGYEIYSVSGNTSYCFKSLIQFYGDFEISIFKFNKGYGLTRIFTHRYSDYGENVKFNLHSKDEEDCNIWTERILEYKKRNNCSIIMNTNFDYLNNLSDISTDEYIYKTYNIGRFPKTTTDFRTVDERMEGFVWLGNWKKFWSYNHPRFWGDLTSREIIDDILAL